MVVPFIFLVFTETSSRRRKRETGNALRSVRLLWYVRTVQWEVNVKRFEPVGCVIAIVRNRGDPVVSESAAAAVTV